MSNFTEHLVDENATVELGTRLANCIRAEGDGAVIHLHGTLGAGKTTFARGILRGLGHTGAVKSPTYTLVEPYELESGNVYHFDLYRIADPEEMEFLGTDSYFAPGNICLFEWAEQGRGHIPAADLEIKLDVTGTGRTLHCQTRTPTGEAIAKRLWP